MEKLREMVTTQFHGGSENADFRCDRIDSRTALLVVNSSREWEPARRCSRDFAFDDHSDKDAYDER